MKRFFLGVSVALFCLPVAAQAPTTVYPYLFPEFMTGEVVFQDGSSLNRQLNIHLRAGRLHVLDETGLIREALYGEISEVRTAEGRFVSVRGEMMRVLAEEDGACVVLSVLADFEALQQTGGAYGSSSSTSATRRLSSFDTDNQINQNHMLLLQSRADGKLLPLVEKRYLLFDGKVIRATKKEISDAVSAERAAELKQFLKTHKINWREPQSLLSLSVFFH